MNKCTGIELRCMWRRVHAVTGFILCTGHCNRRCMVVVHTADMQQVLFEHLLCKRHRINVARECRT